MGVTKTDFMRGMQCPRMLWIDKHPLVKIAKVTAGARKEKNSNAIKKRKFVIKRSKVTIS